MPLDDTTKTRRAPARAKRLAIPAMTTSELTAAVTPEKENVRVTEPRLKTATIEIEGVSPYVQHAFSEKQRVIMEETQRQGQQARGKRVRKPKDFNAAFENAKHVSEEGWLGIPAAAFRNAMIDACRLVGFKMTFAKLSVWVEEDGIDRSEGQPLVRIEGEPQIARHSVRNATGVADIRWRPMWKKWRARVRLTWDEDQFSSTDIANLMMRAGLQVGIGEGRPSSPNSNGVGWGRFRVVS